MLHVSTDKMAGSEGAAQRKLTSENGGRDDTSKTACVVARAGWVGATDAEQVKHGPLGLQDGSAAKRADLQRGHGDRDLKRASEAEGYGCQYTTPKRKFKD